MVSGTRSDRGAFQNSGAAEPVGLAGDVAGWYLVAT